VRSPITVTASASDNTGGSGVAKVDFLVDGVTQATVNVSPAPFTWTWTTTATGSHTLGAKATDVAGNPSTIASVTVTVTDSTQPTAAITAPVNGATVTGSAVAVSASASDNVSVTKVELYVDGALKMTDATSPYSFSLDTTPLANGGHTLSAKAYDAAGNTGTSTNVSVTVSNDTSAPTAPGNLTAAAVSATQVNLGWTASIDNVGVTKYMVQRGGVVIAQLPGTATSYSDTTVVASTGYSYVVIAADGAGNPSPASNTATVTTPAAADTSAPTVPTGLAATSPGPNQVNLTWNASTDTGGSGLRGYKVYRNGTLLTTVATASYGDGTVAAGTSYTYQVTAYDGAGNESAKSVSAAVTTGKLVGDVNGDGKVNVFDLSMLLSAWGTSNVPADINKDSIVNIFDLSILLSKWTG
jgi:fibronectin type 3 domain-containing protein